MISMNFLNPNLYLSNQIVEQLCGIKPVNFEPVDIASDPNFVFENDPNFEALKLYNSEGDVIFVNSWVECANYVSGGWSNNIISSNHHELFFYFLSSLLLGYLLIKRYLSKKEKL